MQIQSVGVIGAGTMGSGIAQVFASAGFDVVLTEVSAAEAEKGVAAIAGRLERLVAKSKISAEDKALSLRRISASGRLEDLKPVDLLIEATPEVSDLKLAIFRQIDPIVRADTIIASNTSSVSISRLASAVSHPDRFIGLHFFNPVPVMRLVEVVRGLQTSDATHDTVEDLLTKRVGKTPITVKSSPGFVVNRLLLPMLNEAFFALAEGDAAATDIDDAMKLGCNHPIGPLALADLIGLDVLLAVMQTLHSESGESKYRPSPLLREMVAAGYLGRKSGRGVYRY